MYNVLKTTGEKDSESEGPRPLESDEGPGWLRYTAGVLQSMIFGWQFTSAGQSYCHPIDGATLFSEVVFNESRGSVSCECRETLRHCKQH